MYMFDLEFVNMKLHFSHTRKLIKKFIINHAEKHEFVLSIYVTRSSVSSAPHQQTALMEFCLIFTYADK